jgi:hypothetical protein
MQRHCKHTFPIIERLCFLRGPCKVVIKNSSVEKSQSSLETLACRDMSLEAEELELTGIPELTVAAGN